MIRHPRQPAVDNRRNAVNSNGTFCNVRGQNQLALTIKSNCRQACTAARISAAPGSNTKMSPLSLLRLRTALSLA
jgi:hypothetical protein